MDKFKEQIMINALKSDPSKVTFENIDEFFRDVSTIDRPYYIDKLYSIIENTTIYNKTLKTYITMIGLTNSITDWTFNTSMSL